MKNSHHRHPYQRPLNISPRAKQSTSHRSLPPPFPPVSLTHYHPAIRHPRAISKIHLRQASAIILSLSLPSDTRNFSSSDSLGIKLPRRRRQRLSIFLPSAKNASKARRARAAHTYPQETLRIYETKRASHTHFRLAVFVYNWAGFLARARERVVPSRERSRVCIPRPVSFSLSLSLFLRPGDMDFLRRRMNDAFRGTRARVDTSRARARANDECARVSFTWMKIEESERDFLGRDLWNVSICKSKKSEARSGKGGCARVALQDS